MYRTGNAQSAGDILHDTVLCHKQIADDHPCTVYMVVDIDRLTNNKRPDEEWKKGG